MSKRSKESKSRFADWEVTTDAGEDNPPSVQDFPQCWWDRCKRGWYTFRDAKGIAAEFAPGVVLKVRRLEVVPSAAGLALDAEAARAALPHRASDGAVLTEDGWKPGGPVDAYGAALKGGK